jgi:hypothetical protein
VPLWVKLLASQLEQTDIIKAAYLEKDSINAVYKTGVREIYKFKIKRRTKHRGDNCFIIKPGLSVIRQELQIFKEFFNNPLDDSPTYHWCINRNQYREATFIERRIAVHHLLREILNTKPQPDCYPYEVLEQDWAYLQQLEYDRYLVNGAVNCFPAGRLAPHIRILEHFFNPGGDLSGRALWAGLRKVVSRKRIRINSSNIRKAARWYTRRRIINPLVYCALFRALKITGPVGDLHPGFGSKALACALLDIPYFTVKDEQFQRALDLGFSSLTRTDFGWLENQELELLISDNNFESFHMPTGDILNQTRRMLCYASRDERQELIEKFSPTSVLQLYDDSVEAKILRESNYLLLW